MKLSKHDQAIIDVVSHPHITLGMELLDFYVDIFRDKQPAFVGRADPKRCFVIDQVFWEEDWPEIFVMLDEVNK